MSYRQTTFLFSSKKHHINWIFLLKIAILGEINKPTKVRLHTSGAKC